MKGTISGRANQVLERAELSLPLAFSMIVAGCSVALREQPLAVPLFNAAETAPAPISRMNVVVVSTEDRRDDFFEHRSFAAAQGATRFSSARRELAAPDWDL